MGKQNSTISHLDIQPADLRDLIAFTRHEKRCFSADDCWTLLEIIDVLASSQNVRLKIEHDQKMIGFIAGNIKNHTGWIMTISVDPDYQGQGLGLRLLSACELALQVPKVKLCTRSSNHAAIALYQNAGYTQTGTWEAYYVGGEDALIFEKCLKIIN